MKARRSIWLMQSSLSAHPWRLAGRAVRLVLNYSKVIVTLLCALVNADRGFGRDRLRMLLQLVASCSAPRTAAHPL
jgi:signal transduction protein with GAF and PtsI domain